MLGVGYLLSMNQRGESTIVEVDGPWNAYGREAPAIREKGLVIFFSFTPALLTTLGRSAVDAGSLVSLAGC